MPTNRPRHTVTETPPVQAALNELRAKLADGERIDFAELVVLGAQVKARRCDEVERENAAAIERLAEMVRTGSIPYMIDLAAADEVKRLGLIARYE